jgi:hypothetical protein
LRGSRCAAAKKLRDPVRSIARQASRSALATIMVSGKSFGIRHHAIENLGGRQDAGEASAGVRSRTHDEQVLDVLALVVGDGTTHFA